MPIYAYTHDGIPGKGCPCDIEIFQKMADAHLTVCPDCKRAIHRVVKYAPSVRIKATKESPSDSVKRVLGENRKHFDCPWPDAETGKCKRVYLKGSKAQQKRQIQDAVLNTRIAQRRKLTRADVNPINL